MASTLGTATDGRSVNVEINLVPFIDLMSCLTAFLLFTAVWANEARLDVRSDGRERESDVIFCPFPQVSVLVERDAVWIGESRVDTLEKIPRLPGGHDWTRVEDSLRARKASAEFAERPRIEIAATSTPSRPVEYREVVAAMDSAVKVGFTDVVVMDAADLSTVPRR